MFFRYPTWQQNTFDDPQTALKENTVRVVPTHVPAKTGPLVMQWLESVPVP